MTPLSVKQLAANWGVSKSIVYALVQSGELPSFRIGLGRGTIRILESDAEKYAESQWKSPTPPACFSWRCRERG